MLGRIGCRFFPFITLNISCYSLLAYRVSAEKSADNLMGFPMCVFCCFSFAAFNIFSLNLIFIRVLCVSACFPWVYLVWNSGLLILGWLFHLPCYWSFQPKSFKIVFQTLSLFLLLGHHNLNVGALMLSHRSLSLFSFFSTLFSLFCSSAVISIILSSNLHICSYASVILLIPSSVFQLLCCSSLVFFCCCCWWAKQ